MNNKIKESVGTILAHIVKVDNRDIDKEIPVFCSIMGSNFDCNHEEASKFLHSIKDIDYNLDEHLDIVKQALDGDVISKFHLMEQLNHMIYSDTIQENDYKLFENIKNKLFD